MKEKKKDRRVNTQIQTQIEEDAKSKHLSA